MKHLIVLAAIAAAIAGCKAKPTKAECVKLLDHVASIEFAGAADAELVAKVKAEVSAEFMTECLDRMPKAKVTCGLEATDKAGLTRCDLTSDERRQADQAPPEPVPAPAPSATPDAGATTADGGATADPPAESAE